MSVNENHNIHIGKQAEDAVLSILLSRGFCLLERNFRAGRVGELDLILTKDYRLYVVEVKSRLDRDAFGGSTYAVTPVKRMKMKRSTAIFLEERHIFGYDIVFLAGCVTHSTRGVITNVQILPF